MAEPGHGAWINRLLATAGVQPVWASAWERAAALIEPLLGLERSLPVVEFSQHRDLPAWHHRYPNARTVKIDILNSLYRHQPLIWIDDSITSSRVGHRRVQHQPVRRRYQHVDRLTGLSARDIEQVQDFIAWTIADPLPPRKVS